MIKIGYLYGHQMNIYGDTGNVLALKKRLEWRGIKVEVKYIDPGYKVKKGEFDLYFFGGGQDEQQDIVAKDLSLGNGKVLREEIERGVPLLSICGGYQLLGEYYQPFSGPKLPGVGIFKAFTKASDTRMIGNIVIKLSDKKQKSDDWRLVTDDFLVGFENHSGKTYLKKDAIALGTVEKGFGNNGEDKTEGSIYKHAIGCYMHGSLLPKNPQLADWLIDKALEVKTGKDVHLKPLDDTLETLAHQKAVDRFK